MVFFDRGNANPLTIFFYSTFFTSVWLWLYVASALLAKLIHRLRLASTRLLPLMDIEAKPLTVVGRVAGLLAGICYGLVFCLLSIAHELR
jgi:hypothetical protein